MTRVGPARTAPATSSSELRRDVGVWRHRMRGEERGFRPRSFGYATRVAEGEDTNRGAFLGKHAVRKAARMRVERGERARAFVL